MTSDQAAQLITLAQQLLAAAVALFDVVLGILAVLVVNTWGNAQ